MIFLSISRKQPATLDVFLCWDIYYVVTRNKKIQKIWILVPKTPRLKFWFLFAPAPTPADPLLSVCSQWPLFFFYFFDSGQLVGARFSRGLFPRWRPLALATTTLFSRLQRGRRRPEGSRPAAPAPRSLVLAARGQQQVSICCGCSA